MVPMRVAAVFRRSRVMPTRVAATIVGGEVDADAGGRHASGGNSGEEEGGAPTRREGGVRASAGGRTRRRWSLGRRPAATEGYLGVWEPARGGGGAGGSGGGGGGMTQTKAEGSHQAMPTEGHGGTVATAAIPTQQAVSSPLEWVQAVPTRTGPARAIRNGGMGAHSDLRLPWIAFAAPVPPLPVCVTVQSAHPPACCT